MEDGGEGIYPVAGDKPSPSLPTCVPMCVGNIQVVTGPGSRSSPVTWDLVIPDSASSHPHDDDEELHFMGHARTVHQTK